MSFEIRELEKKYGSPLIFEEYPFLRGIGSRFVKNKFFDAFQEYLVNKYEPPHGKRILFLTVCTWGKPYSQSYIRYKINEILYKVEAFGKIHQVVVSNSGIVPQEWENLYPFVAYDWDPKLETEKSKRIYLEITRNRVESFFLNHIDHYKHVFSYLRPSSESQKAVKDVVEKLGIEVSNLVVNDQLMASELEEISLGGYYDDHDHVLLAKENLQNLEIEIRNIVQYLE